MILYYFDTLSKSQGIWPQGAERNEIPPASCVLTAVAHSPYSNFLGKAYFDLFIVGLVIRTLLPYLSFNDSMDIFSNESGEMTFDVPGIGSMLLLSVGLVSRDGLNS